MYILIFLLLMFGCSERKETKLERFSAEISETTNTELSLESEIRYVKEIENIDDNHLIVKIAYNLPCYFCCNTINGKINQEGNTIKLIAEYSSPVKQGDESRIVVMGECTILFDFEVKSENEDLRNLDYEFEFINND